MEDATDMHPERLRILVLEDSHTKETGLNTELQRLPFHFTVKRAVTRSGLQDELRRFQPDVILYHAWRKGMGELEALGFARRHAPDVPVIIIDGSLDERTARQCLNAGAAEILTRETLIRLGPAIRQAVSGGEGSAGAGPRRVLPENAAMLRRNERLFRSLIENSSDGIVLVDETGTVLYASPSTSRILGYDRSEYEGHDALALVHPEDRERVTAVFRDLVATPGGNAASEYRYRTADGGWRWVDAVARNLLDDPLVRGIVVNYRDTTDARDAVEALRKSNERHRAYIDQSTEGIWRIELDEPMPEGAEEPAQVDHILRYARVAECNEPMARLCGCAGVGELQGRSLRDLLDPDDDRLRDHLYAFVRGGYRLVNRESTERVRGVSRTLLHNVAGVVEQGRLVRAWGTHRDVTDQKEAEGKVTILAHALRSISEGVFISSLRRRLVFVNQALLDMYGYTQDQLIGRSVEALGAFGRNPGGGRDIYAATLDGGWKGELTHRRADGSRLVIAVSTSVVRSELGEAIALMGVVRDVTEQRRVERLQDAVYRIAQAADSTRSLNDLYAAVHAIIQEVMPANNFYLALYDEHEDLLHFPYFVDEIDVPLPPMQPGKGLTAHVLCTGRSLLCTEQVWDRLVRAGEVELVGVPSPIWLGVPLIVAHKTIGVMVVQHYSDAGAYGPVEQHMLEFVSSQVAQAVERKRREEALRESEERYRQMFEDDLTGDFISTPGGKILACNPAFASIFGFASVEEALRSDCSILHKDSSAREDIFESVRTHRRLSYHEMELRRKDGRPIYAVANLIGTFDEHDRMVSVKGYLFDNTERKRLEDQLLQSQKMEAVGQLASGIAHDFNNVMSVTLTAAQMVRTAQSLDAATRYAQMIEEATLRGSAIAKQLLQFSRAEAATLSPISLAHVVNEVKKILDHSLPKTIVVRLAINLKQGVVMGDAGQIHQLLLNLCINARDAMTSSPDREGAGTLSILLESVPGEWVARRFGAGDFGEFAALRVSDTGTGIAPDVLRRIFDPFFTTKGIGKGTGLGLSIVHGIVKSHHAHLDVETELGKGTTFTVYFPIVAQGSVTATPACAPPPRGRGETILVIEDEEVLRILMREMLVGAGYRVLEASDGEEGVAVYRERRAEVDIVISDMGLPKLSGEQVFRALLTIEPAVQVIFSTGYVRDEQRQELLDAGARRFIHKPYRVNELLAALREVLDARA